MSLVDTRPDQVWGILDPWGHHYPDQGDPGPAIGFQQVALEWWDHWLKPEPDAEAPWPKLRVWLREFDAPQDTLDVRNGGWIESGPTSGQALPRVLHFSEGGRLVESGSHMGDDWAVPADLLHGMTSGDTGCFGRFGGLLLKQNDDDDRALVFETEPLEQDVVLYGSAAVALEVAAEFVRSQLCLRLNDVSPEGNSARVGRSVLNLALDDQLDAPATPHGTNPHAVQIRFHASAYRFKAGHRIRLSVGSSYWPLVWTPPQLGAVRILSGQLTLPELTEAPCPLSTQFPAPLGTAAPNDVHVLTAPTLIRKSETQAYGTVSVSWHQPPLATLYSDIETTFSFETSVAHSVTPGGALSASTYVQHDMEVLRGDGTAQVQVRLRAQSTSEAYSVDTLLLVSWERKELARRNWAVSVERHLS